MISLSYCNKDVIFFSDYKSVSQRIPPWLKISREGYKAENAPGSGDEYKVAEEYNILIQLRLTHFPDEILFFDLLAETML